ncbi:putative disintegrin and metalloproteinase domain-containing protein 19-like, partial [Scophthalmus maximus]
MSNELTEHYQWAGPILVKEHVLSMELLSPDFSETYYTDDGQPVTVTNHNYTDHCFYHGHVRGHPESWVALSTCSGVRGLISLNSSDTYYLEPMSDVDPHHHSLLRAEELPIKGGNCGHGHHTAQSNHISDLLRPFHSRVKRNTWGTTKYMELYIVADNMLFKWQNKDYEKTKARIMEIANYVDKFYRALNIRVPLIGLEVWTDRDQCIVTEEPNATLWSFLQWRQKLKSRKKHDNAQLLTGVIFNGTTIGMAPLEGMCSLESSGGITVDHSELSIGAAATMAHEIGHNFGMSHDHEGCCVEATAEQGGCVMAAATGHPFPRVFSRCSKRDLDSYFQKGGGMCLFNMPNMKDLVGGKKCGNGFVEDGEECDCGEPDECTNDCCNANNCTLKAEAQCAHGVCCEGCKLKQAGTMCRGPAGACDLPEYCTGASPYCPSNVYLLDGSSCQYGVAYCYNGMCLTHEQQCLQLWGYGARPAHDACFEDVNAAGNAFGNCGKNEHGNYMKCEKSDAKCGKIQCHSAAKKPKGTNAVSIDTTIRTDGIEVKCRGTYVYSTQDGQGDLPDPGLVMTGTKCAEGKVGLQWAGPQGEPKESVNQFQNKVGSNHQQRNRNSVTSVIHRHVFLSGREGVFFCVSRRSVHEVNRVFDQHPHLAQQMCLATCREHAPLPGALSWAARECRERERLPPQQISKDLKLCSEARQQMPEQCLYPFDAEWSKILPSNSICRNTHNSYKIRAELCMCNAYTYKNAHTLSNICPHLLSSGKFLFLCLYCFSSAAHSSHFNSTSAI